MAIIKPSYAASAAINCTLASLANGSSQQSDAVNNAVNLYDDVLVSLAYSTGTGTVGNGRLLIWAFGAMDDVPNYTDGAGAYNAAFATANIANAKLLAIAVAAAASTHYNAGPWSLANAFGGRLPQQWGIIVQNDQGNALDSTAANFVLEYIGVQYTVA
ncbi:MAG: hypothetical protein ACYCW6_08495 [Candidatus Xenobia bacterium]